MSGLRNSSGETPRLLFVAERYPPDVGGVARSARRIAGAFAREGVATHVFSWTRTLPAGELVTVEDAGVTVHRMGLFASWDLSMQHALNVLEWLDGRAPFDAVWGHYVYPSGFLAVWFAEQRRRPSIVSARGNDIDQLMFPPGDFARLRWALERATRRVAVSGDLARKIAVLLGDDAGIDVIHNAVDTRTFSPRPSDVRTGLAVEPGTAVLGFCGELRHKKGAPFLIRALADVQARRPAVLLVIGEARAREQALLAELTAEQPALAARVRAVGQLEDPAAVAQHLAACDVALFPSLWDGLPNALLESMACAVPVIASDAGGMPEVVRDGETGVLVPKAQLHRLGEQVLALLDDPARARRLGEAGRAAVCGRYDEADEGPRLLEVLARAMSG
jgi:glycosyltransferase involved in cell wall biosynthesis